MDNKKIQNRDDFQRIYYKNITIKKNITIINLFIIGAHMFHYKI